MDELFGIPMESLALGILLALAILVGAIGALALRNRIFLKLGIRNVTRRRARTALIVLGLMLGTTIIASALATGDTMSHTIRSSAITSLGDTDELVSVRGADVQAEEELGSTTGIEYFSEDIFPEVEYELLLGHEELIDGVAPAIIEPLAVQSVTTRQSEPRVTLFASDQAHLGAFGEIRRHSDGEPQYLNDLRPGEVFLNSDAADDLQAAPGHALRLYAEGASVPVKVREIVDYEGAGTDGGALILPLDQAQRLLHRVGQIKHVLISNRGDELSGADLTDQVTRIVNPVVTPRGLEVDPVKEDALEAADAEGNAFMTLFTTFGSFSIFAGALLIFLIFVMLAAERRGELGIARAVGTRRGHLVQLYLFEGLAYDLVAAAVGSLLGVAVAFGMVFVMAQALDFTGVEIQHDVTAESLIVGFGMGVLLTFVIVTVSAWRVSRLNIVAAIRNTPEPLVRKSRKRRWIPGILAILLGVLLTMSGLSAADAAAFMLGVSLVVVGAVPLARAAGLSERIVFTIAGLALVVWWLLPFDTVETLAGKELKWGFGVWIMGGIFVVLGSAWTLIFNADILLGGLTATVGRIRALTPILKMAIAYPLRNRFRTGVTLAMFTLVVFTLVVGAVISGSFINAMNNPEQFGGGFDIRAQAAPTNPIIDMDSAIRQAQGLNRTDFTVVSEQSFLAAEARQVGYKDGFTDYGVRGLDDAFLRHTTFGFAARARGYDSPEEVWSALADRPGFAVVDSIVAPRRDNWNAGAVLPDFKLHGFLLEDGTFDPLTLMTRDPQTGKTLKLTVIGILAETVPFAMQGISTSQSTLESAYGDRVQPTAYYYALADGVDPRAEAPKLESTFVANGLEADALDEVLEDSIAVQWTFNRLIQGFMGLGLIVGIAALGVISARAVVERRQQIGILRALGFRRRMIQLSFLIESSFIALTAIVVGTVLALIVAVNVIDDTASQSSWSDIAIVVPWVNMAIIFGAVYAAALLATLAPAVRASRVYPAEALRYE
ncbi:MAG TPA: FtsX-like permease family protein [Gaiellaceae bacterium]|nr:FtsX-like permease family protein [Gaiellaceae bacterium]